MRVTIWDNFERHCGELRAVGAAESDLTPLRAAAQAVADAECSASRLGISIAAASLPLRSCTGWTIAPPTMAARYWARIAMLKATGGVQPGGPIGEVHALLAGLLILRLWGEGQHDVVMSLCAGSSELPERLAAEAEAAVALVPDQLGREWIKLMGIKPDKKKALAQYNTLRADLRRRYPTTRPLSSTRRRPRGGKA